MLVNNQKTLTPRQKRVLDYIERFSEENGYSPSLNEIAKFIKKAIYAGKHVLCEKPLVLNLEQAKKVFRLAKKKKVMLRTAFHRRFNKNMIRLINKSKTFGKIKRIEASYFEKIEDHSNKRRDYNHIRKYSDGCVIDNGTNMIDIFLHLLRNIKFTKAYIGYKKRGKNYLDDKATIYFSFKEGLIILKLDWSYSGEKKDMKIITTEGSINIDFLKDFKNFKSSLWHEYNSLFSEFLNHLKKGDFYEKNDLLVISLIDKIYHSKKTYKYRLYK